ncbi:MAG: circadian clock protein KaiC [Bacteroidota bacterium]
MKTENTITLEQTAPEIKSIIKKLEKSLTGIKGLDEITYGGIPKNRPTVLVGGSGTGKTFMSLEYIVNGAILFNEPGLFVTFEERTEDLIVNALTLGHDLQKLISEKKILIEHLNINNNEILEVGKYNIDGLFVILDQAIQKVNAKRIVLDSFDTLFSNFDTRILRSEFKRLFFWLKEKKVTAIITAEIGDTFLTRLGLEENVADCVIELNNRLNNQIGTRRIRILKYRGSFHSNNEYPFLIDEKGMTVFPVINQSIDFKISNERISLGLKTLDEMLDNKGVYLGSSILISGTAGTGKSSLSMTFVNNACKSNISCLYCAFEESPNQIIRNMLSIGIDVLPLINSNKLKFYHAIPTLQNLELHFMAIKEQIEKSQPTIIILDPVSNLITEGPNSDVRIMLTQFIWYLKTKKLTVMFTAAITLNSISLNQNDEGITSTVDTWIMLQDIDLFNKRVNTLEVKKSRGMNHSKQKKEIKISSDGISLLPMGIE